MFWLTEDATLVCDHRGRISVEPSQRFVTVRDRAVLVENDPEGQRVSWCPNYGPTVKPCRRTLRVKAGYSPFVFVDGRRVCLDAISGLTDGTPPGIVTYIVTEAGQDFVSGATE